jgi:hypothetical protein
VGSCAAGAQQKAGKAVPLYLLLLRTPLLRNSLLRTFASQLRWRAANAALFNQKTFIHDVFLVGDSHYVALV